MGKQVARFAYEIRKTKTEFEYQVFDNGARQEILAVTDHLHIAQILVEALNKKYDDPQHRQSVSSWGLYA